jgi:hypothetical protein
MVKATRRMSFIAKRVVKDPLILLIVFLQIVSAKTTIDGANIVLPTVGILLGGFIQIILTFLLLFEAAKEAPVRRWFSVIVLTLVSIYASFFSFYTQLTEAKYHDIAVQAHNQLVQNIYTPLQEKLTTLKNDNKTYKEKKDKAESGEGEDNVIPGKGGEGSEYQKWTKKENAAKQEIGPLESKLIEIKPLFEVEISQKKPQEIFELDQKAFKSITKEFAKKQGITLPEMDGKNYGISKVSNFLTPFNELNSSNRNKIFPIDAIASILIALIIDGITLILGTAIDPHRSNMFAVFSNACIFCILGFRRMLSTIRKVSKREVESFEIPEADGLRESVKLMITLDGDGYDFLSKFYDSVDLKTYIIDIDKLIKDEKSSSFRRGYRLLFHTMCHDPSKWIEAVKIDKKNLSKSQEINPANPEELKDECQEQFCIAAKHFPAFLKWIRRELHNQAQRKNIEISGVLEIEINMPF